MQDKIYILAAYALLGLGIALWPWGLMQAERMAPAGMSAQPWIQATIHRFSGPWARVAIYWLKPAALLLIALGLIYWMRVPITSLLPVFCLVALATSIAARRLHLTATLTSIIALCSSTSLLWWSPEIAIADLAIFSLVTAAGIYLFTSRGGERAGGSSMVWIAAYSLVAVLFTFSTGIYGDRFAFHMTWHHWGAYIGPAELLRSGAAIFHDFPAQYGLGPTATIAAACSRDCWHGMYFVVGLASLAFSVLIAILGLSLARPRWPERLVVLALCLAASFMWAGYPPEVTSPLTFPSVSGLRFLPATVLLTHLFFAGNIERSKAKLLLAHGLWALGVLWSPESAFYVTFLWWPYYVFIRRRPGPLSTRVMGIVEAAATLLAVAVILMVCFVGVYLLIYREMPTLYGILAYAIDPPGPLPINWHGAIWYFLLVLGVGLGILVQGWRRDGDTQGFRRGFLLLLLSYGVSSYFLGRSHDNNLLNLLPFFLLVMLSALQHLGNGMLPRMQVVLAAALLGWLPLLGWAAWHENLVDGEALQFDPLISDSFVPQRRIAHSIHLITGRYREPVTILNKSFVVLHLSPPDPWSAFHGPENFAFMPSHRRREFLSRTAASLRRTGWLMIDRNFPAEDWLADYDAVYRRTGFLDFGRYYAIRYSPRQR